MRYPGHRVEAVVVAGGLRAGEAERVTVQHEVDVNRPALGRDPKGFGVPELLAEPGDPDDVVTEDDHLRLVEHRHGAT
jgi:hypothetical protein